MLELIIVYLVFGIVVTGITIYLDRWPLYTSPIENAIAIGVTVLIWPWMLYRMKG